MDANASPASFTADLLSCAALPELTGDEVADLFTAALLRESHAVLHTWPETGMVNIDIFSCTTRLQSLDAIAELGRSLGAAAVSIQEIARADGHYSPSDPRR
jgi:hypothetical protein